MGLFQVQRRAALRDVKYSMLTIRNNTLLNI